MDHRISAPRLVARRARQNRHLHTGQFIDQLEERRLLSATLDNINWRGATVQAIANSYIVEVKSGVDFNTIAAKKGFTNVQGLGGNGFYSFDSADSPNSLYHWGTNSSNILGIQPNTPVYAASVPTPPNPAVIPNDTYFQTGDQYDMYNYGQTITNFYGVPLAGTPGADIDATQAWTISTGSKNVVVAILDTGVDITHPDLAANIWTNQPEQNGSTGIDDDTDGYIDDYHGWNTIDNNNNVNDGQGHGTNVAGIIGAQGNNGIGIAGVNWNVTMIPVKVLDDTGAGTAASIIEGVEYVTTLKNLWVATGGKDGADITVANLSLGGTQFPYDTLDARAYQLAGKAGILFAIAAGNGTNDNGVPANNDTSFNFPGKYSLNLSNVIGVASVDNTGQLSLFSNYGAQSVQVAAPGEQIWSTYPVSLDTADGNPDGYTALSGTSQATPHVTGIIALMKAVDPNATAAQLKQALFDSVDVLPTLSAETSTASPKVTTGGEVNAYKALLAIQNMFVKSDTDTKGNWRGFGAGNLYGTQGAYIAGESTTFPTGVTITGGSTDVIADSSKKVNKNISALQTIADPSQRIEAGLTSATSINVDLNLATPTQVTLYLADYDKQKRTEEVQVIDPATGQSLSGKYPQTVSNFSGGEYLTYQVNGNVELRITKVAGPNAILSGVFLDPVATASTVASPGYGNFVANNTTNKGNWQASFGSQGQYFPGVSNSFPSFVTVSVSGATNASGGSAAAMLQNASGKGHVAGYLATDSQMTLDMNFTDGAVHQTTFYVADTRNKKLAERISVVDASTGNVLASQDVSAFKNGQYISFDLSGHVQVQITRLAGPDAVLNGVFFDAPPGKQVSYVGIDSTTSGNWMGNYGAGGAYIIGQSPTTLTLGPDFDNATVTVNVLGATPEVISTRSKSKAALEFNTGVNATRVLSRFVSRTGMTINLDFSDSVTHQVAIYVADTDSNNHRSEIISASDAATETITAQQQVSNFKNGKYVIFSVRGDVNINVTNVAGSSAVVNGIFID